MRTTLCNDTSDYIKSEQVSVVKEEIAWSVMDILVPLSSIFNNENTWGVMDILDPLSEIFDGKEAVTKHYHKPHLVDDNILK